MRQQVTGSAVTLCAVLAATGLFAANAPPPQPPRVSISDVSVDAKRARFTINFAPVARYTMYQFVTDPKPGCKYTTAAPVAGKGPFVAQSFAPGGPFKTSVECACGTKFIARVAVAPPDAYTGRSAWTDSSPVDMTCRR